MYRHFQLFLGAPCSVYLPNLCGPFEEPVVLPLLKLSFPAGGPPIAASLGRAQRKLCAWWHGPLMLHTILV